MKTNQMRMKKRLITQYFHSKGFGLHLHFGKDSKAGKVGKLYSENRRHHLCPGWRLWAQGRRMQVSKKQDILEDRLGTYLAFSGWPYIRSRDKN